MSKVIITTQCESCIYGKTLEINKSCIKVKCDLKNKVYYYGACIPCDEYVKRKRE